MVHSSLKASALFPPLPRQEWSKSFIASLTAQSGALTVAEEQVVELALAHDIHEADAMSGLQPVLVLMPAGRLDLARCGALPRLLVIFDTCHLLRCLHHIEELPCEVAIRHCLNVGCWHILHHARMPFAKGGEYAPDFISVGSPSDEVAVPRDPIVPVLPTRPPAPVQSGLNHADERDAA